MTTKIVCDRCGHEETGKRVRREWHAQDGRLGVHISYGLTGTVSSEDDEHYCLYCVIDAINTLDDRPKQASQPAQPRYSWRTPEDYAKEVGFAINDAFRIGWNMARTTDDLFEPKATP